MELDDLKQSWNEANKDSKPLNTNIMELLKNKSYSPLVALHRKYRMAVIMLPLLFIFITIDAVSVNFNTNSKIALYIFFFLMLVVISIITLNNYSITRRLMKNNRLLIANIKHQVKLIEKSLKIQSYIIIGIGLSMIIIFEIMIHRHEVPGNTSEILLSIPDWQRILFYLACAAIAWISYKLKKKYPTGIYAHLEHLKDLLKQAE